MRPAESISPLTSWLRAATGEGDSSDVLILVASFDLPSRATAAVAALP